MAKMVIDGRIVSLYNKIYPFGVLSYPNFIEAIKKGIDVVWTIPEPQKISDKPIKAKVTPWSMQKKVIDIFDEHIHAGSIEAPTGSGKTNMQAFLIAKRNISTIIIVPTIDLVEQTKKRFLEVLDIDKELIGTTAKDIGKPILISTWQGLTHKNSFEKNIKKINDYGYGMVLCDEWHRASAEQYNKLVDSIKAKYKHGWSATIDRGNSFKNKKMRDITGRVIYKIDIEELYKNKKLVRPTIVKIPTGVSISLNSIIEEDIESELITDKKKRWFAIKSAIKKYGNSADYYNRAFYYDKILNKRAFLELKECAIEQKRVFLENQKNTGQYFGFIKKNIDKNIKRKKIIYKSLDAILNKTKSTMILFNTIDSVKEFYEHYKSKLKDKNIFYITGDTKDKKELIIKLSNGDIEDYIIFGTVSLLGEGIDIPTLANIVVCSPIYPPFGELGRMQQVVGRIMRGHYSKFDKDMGSVNLFLFDDKFIEEMEWVENKKQISENYTINNINAEFKKIKNIV